MATRAEKEAVLDFAKYCDQRVRVRFQGGREVDGVLKGYDKLDNLVLEDSIEYLRGKIIVLKYVLCGLLLLIFVQQLWSMVVLIAFSITLPINRPERPNPSH